MCLLRNLLAAVNWLYFVAKISEAAGILKGFMPEVEKIAGASGTKRMGNHTNIYRMVR